MFLILSKSIFPKRDHRTQVNEKQGSTGPEEITPAGTLVLKRPTTAPSLKVGSQTSLPERYAHLAPDHLHDVVSNLGFSAHFQHSENLKQAVVGQNGVIT